MPALLDFQYLPLDPEQQEIRLLTLFPGQGCHVVQGTISHISLKNEPNPVYETISYAWGDPTLRKSIRLDGHRLRVPTNTLEALHRLRLPDENRTLWIDAVCIDQHSITERNHQVALMREVFSHGERNIVYLGEPDGCEDSAVASIRALIKDASNQTRDFEDFRKTTINESNNWAISSSGLGTDIDEQALEYFFSKEWFKRLWVVQEAALARYSLCVCGTILIELVDVLLAATWLYNKINFIPLSLFHTPGVHTGPFLLGDVDREARYIRPYSAEKFDIATLLYYQRTKTVSDPRDRVYGMLGLMRDTLLADPPCALIPDYSKDSATVLRDATRLSIYEKPHGLDQVVRYVAHHTDDELCSRERPTWVPSWTRVHSKQEPAWMHRLYSAHGNSSIKEPDDLGASMQPDVLHLHGCCIGEISECLPYFSTKDFGSASCLLERLDEAGRFSTTTLQRQENLTLGHVLLAGQNDEDSLSTDSDGAEMRLLKDYLRRHNRLPPLFLKLNPGVGEATRAAAHFLRQFYSMSEFRSLFACGTPVMLGLGPKLLRKGDMVAVLHGCGYPVVLRPHEGGTFKLLGLCYVHGIMNGEAVDKQEAEGREPDVFDIC